MIKVIYINLHFDASHLSGFRRLLPLGHLQGVGGKKRAIKCTEADLRMGL